MSSTHRYPRSSGGIRGPSEADQIITLMAADAGPIPVGGPATYIDITPWWLVGNSDETPYNCVSLEFTCAAGALTVGNGLAPICLFGVIGDLTTGSKFKLKGFLGDGLGLTFPQIQIISAAIGFSQNVNLVGVFNGLAIGGLTDPIELASPLTVKARPFRLKNYIG